MAPTFVALYTFNNVNNTTPISFSIPNVQVGDLLVWKQSGADYNIGSRTPVTTGETWNHLIAINVSGYCTVGISTMVATTAGTKAISSTWLGGGTQEHSGVVEHWRNAQVGPNTATQSNLTNQQPSMNITTTGTDSVVSWVNSDWTAQSGTNPTYRGTVTEEYKAGLANTSYWVYYVRQAAASPGTQTVGLTAPSGQKPTMGAIEVQTAAVNGTFPATTASDATASGGDGALLSPDGRFTTDTGNADAEGLLGILTSDMVERVYAGTATGTSWVHPEYAAGAPDGLEATWASETPAAVSPPLVLSNFGDFADIPVGSTLESVQVSCHNHQENGGIASVTLQAYLGASPVGSPFTLTLGATDHDDVFTVTGVTLADLRTNTLSFQIVGTKT